LAYADDVTAVSKNKIALKDPPVNIEIEATQRGLLINENKTKYMEVTRQQLMASICNAENINWNM
jgi:hypothetical protein